MCPPLDRWVVLDLETREVISDYTDGNEQLSVMRYSPGDWSEIPVVVTNGCDAVCVLLVVDVLFTIIPSSALIITISEQI